MELYCHQEITQSQLRIQFGNHVEKVVQLLSPSILEFLVRAKQCINTLSEDKTTFQVSLRTPFTYFYLPRSLMRIGFLTVSVVFALEDFILKGRTLCSYPFFLSKGQSSLRNLQKGSTIVFQQPFLPKRISNSYLLLHGIPLQKQRGFRLLCDQSNPL